MCEREHSLSNEEVARFSRQLLVREIGVKGQERIGTQSLLIVGAGGLGCPVALYCAGAGFNRIGIVDDDSISLNNLHRQIAYDETQIGKSKVKELRSRIKMLNENINVITYEKRLNKFNASEIVEKYDIVADCSDNVSTRYLINDACVLGGKPLVSGSVLRWEGQFTVYNYGKNCPCYRCIFQKPPPPETVSNCSESGVIGPVVGIIGSMQAVELIKIAAIQKSSYAGRLFLFDGFNGITKTVKLRGRNSECIICGNNPTVTRLEDCFKMYDQCEKCDQTSISILNKMDRVTPIEFHELNSGNHRPYLIDIRPTHEFEIGHLPGSSNIPFTSIMHMNADDIVTKLGSNPKMLETRGVCVICRRGNDSQLVVQYLRKQFAASSISVTDIEGGYEYWIETVDKNFPLY